MTMTTAALLARAHDGGVGDDDPAAKPKRRRFDAAYKLAILDEYARLTDPGAKGALLRREGRAGGHAGAPPGTAATEVHDAAAGAAQQADRRGDGPDPRRVALGALR